MIDKDLIRNKISNIEDLPNTTILKTLNDFEKRIDNVVKGVVDDAPSLTSENPLQNKVVTMELNNKVNYSDSEIQYLEQEYEKSANLAKINSNSGLTNNNNFALNANIKSGKTYTLTLNTNSELNFNLKKNNISGTILRTFYNVTNKFKYTFTADWNGDLFLNIFEASPTLTDIMLVEGENEIPYQPYNGPIVHEKDLGELLFSGSTCEDVILSKNVSNYNYLDITYHTLYGNDLTTIRVPAQDNIAIIGKSGNAIWETRSLWYSIFFTYLISGDRLLIQRKSQFYTYTDTINFSYDGSSDGGYISIRTIKGVK